MTDVQILDSSQQALLRQEERETTSCERAVVSENTAKALFELPARGWINGELCWCGGRVGMYNLECVRISHKLIPEAVCPLHLGGDRKRELGNIVCVVIVLVVLWLVSWLCLRGECSTFLLLLMTPLAH